MNCYELLCGGKGLCDFVMLTQRKGCPHRRKNKALFNLRLFLYVFLLPGGGPEHKTLNVCQVGRLAQPSLASLVLSS